MLKTFIERPVLSTVISIIIVILGILGMTILPITQYPEIAPPTVQINATFPGANAQTVLESVIIPIEEQVNGVENMDYIKSTATNNGTASIQVLFKQGVDPDIAAVNVQNRVARAAPLLPAEVNRTGVVTQKQQTSAVMFLSFYSTSPNLDRTFVQNYANIHIVPELKRVNGVGDVNIFGRRNYSMRIWLDPIKMANYNLVPFDVTNAINQQSLEAAAGQLGENDGQTFQYVLRYKGRYNDETEYENIVVKALPNGETLYLKDVAEIEMGAESYAGYSMMNGNDAVAGAIYQTAGSNAQTIIKDLKIKLQELEKDFPEGMNYLVVFDTNEFLDSSISKVVSTLIEAFILVFLVVFVFLQDFRSTLIPLIAVPVSIVGTFFFLNLFGYSINLLTLFALVLAIGIVVDDAIVVVEAVHAKIEQEHREGKEVTNDAMNEIAGAIISITLVLISVFVPVTFIQGPTGVFYQQFGVTLIVAVIISAVNALTLSPALCAIVLKAPKPKEERKRNIFTRLADSFNRGFRSVTLWYIKTFGFFLRHKWVTYLILILCGVLIFMAQNTMKSGFVPNEDRGFIMGNFEMPPGATSDRLAAVQNEFYDKAIQIPGIKVITLSAGFSFISGQGSNYGMAMISLDNFDERKGPGMSTDEITGKLFGLAASMPEANMIFFAPPSVPGFGVSSGFEVKLMDRTGGDIREFNQVSDGFIADLMKRPEIQYAQTSFNTEYTQFEIDLNIPRAEQSGVSVSSIFSALQGYVGGIYAADFARYGKQYRVMVQAKPDARASVEDLQNIFVRTSSGQMTPITQFVTLRKINGPQNISRYNLFTSSEISGASNPGYSSGDAIRAVQEVASSNLSSSYGIDFTGLSREEVKAGNQTLLIFVLSLVFVYFVLSAQFESYLLPLSVILSLPGGVMGAYWAQKLFGLENNIYFQIALIMLVGLLAKNAILIVEFAVQRRRAGETIAASAINGAKARLRPILMTSFAFIFGMMPLVFATGVGYVGNRSIGTGAAFGLLVGTLTGIFNIPVLYAVFQWLQEKVAPVKFDKKNKFELENPEFES